ncbi:hypothetical protein ACUNWD_10870 [Sunxiuqinia sp. A32]|uniref:hypothetical protein n=1 Tax=Sunxiuqinia sp. A32 TaxID=3461496 RepID=UPI004045F105
MGSVAVDAIGNGDAAVKHVKKKAAQMGADAIIKVELNKASPSASRTGISRVAVKMKDQTINKL